MRLRRWRRWKTVTIGRLGTGAGFAAFARWVFAVRSATALAVSDLETSIWIASTSSAGRTTGGGIATVVLMTTGAVSRQSSLLLAGVLCAPWPPRCVQRLRDCRAAQVLGRRRADRTWNPRRQRTGRRSSGSERPENSLPLPAAPVTKVGGRSTDSNDLASAAPFGTRCSSQSSQGAHGAVRVEQQWNCQLSTIRFMEILCSSDSSGPGADMKMSLFALEVPKNWHLAGGPPITNVRSAFRFCGPPLCNSSIRNQLEDNADAHENADRPRDHRADSVSSRIAAPTFAIGGSARPMTSTLVASMRFSSQSFSHVAAMEPDNRQVKQSHGCSRRPLGWPADPPRGREQRTERQQRRCTSGPR